VVLSGAISGGTWSSIAREAVWLGRRGYASIPGTVGSTRSKGLLLGNSPILPVFSDPSESMRLVVTYSASLQYAILGTFLVESKPVDRKRSCISRLSPTPSSRLADHHLIFMERQSYDGVSLLDAMRKERTKISDSDGISKWVEMDIQIEGRWLLN
jgi:hypothetical protein